MSGDTYHKRKVGNRVLQPETQMMGYGYDPSLSEGSLKPPIFLTSTFVFRNAQDGKDFFDYTSGRRVPPPGKTAGLVYSRFNNPNLEVLEDRLALWEGGESAAVFSRYVEMLVALEQARPQGFPHQSIGEVDQQTQATHRDDHPDDPGHVRAGHRPGPER